MTFDWSITKPESSKNLNCNVAIGTGLGILTSGFYLQKVN